MIMSHSRQPHQPFSTPRHLTPLPGRYLGSGSPATPFNTSLSSSPSTPCSSSSSGVDSSFSSDSGKESGSSPPTATATSTTTAKDHPPSRTSQYKKIMKPLLERKRRARINKCLDELKDIMTSALQAQGENVSKLEKADILELTVRHLHKMQQAKCLTARNPIEELRRFQTGYSSCAQEATSFLMSTPGVDVTVGHRLLSYLSSQMASPMATAAAVQARLAGPASQPGPVPADLYHQFNPRLVSQPLAHSGPVPVQPQPPMLHKFGRFSPTADPSRILIKQSNSPPIVQGLVPKQGSTPPPSSSVGFRSKDLPPRPSSTPQTLGHFTVSIRSEGLEPGTFGDLCPQEPSNNNKNLIVPSSSVIKPAPIRLNPSDPVWRPF